MIKVNRPVWCDGNVVSAGVYNNPSPNLLALAETCAKEGNDIITFCDESGHVLSKRGIVTEEIVSDKYTFMSGEEFKELKAIDQTEYLTKISETPSELSEDEKTSYESDLFDVLNVYSDFAKAKVKDVIANMLAEYDAE